MSTTKTTVDDVVRAVARDTPAFTPTAPAPGNSFTSELLGALRRDQPAPPPQPKPAWEPLPTLDAIAGVLLTMLTHRVPAARRHAAAVAHYAGELGRAAGFTGAQRTVVRTAGLLHDLGTLAFRDHLLLDRCELQPGERAQVERHPVDGVRLMMRLPGMREVAEAVLSHHERYDGTGYPNGLAGEWIPLSARILAVAEVYDTLTAPDRYRAPLPPDLAQQELGLIAGSQLDPELVELFVSHVLPLGHEAHGARIAVLEAELAAS
ncbi:HD domain-containing protein [Solirubrobacter phytolaccae]|uniref:HD domain-containing protein n=1 Tax=Solirubrobacter phytolaccae TaxID=1404360 RepID=A0A9X3SEP6_9ACTN|nr:HD domain-containing phosphohydrolase [Solirubrobacter phytolaccae]MDA0185135.1 HD domain-containing protein [Solirubrobacter phytolaccae]